MLGSQRISAFVWPFLILALLLCTSPATSDIRLPAMISDNMILQRDFDITLWGWADPAEQVTATIAGKSVSSKTDSGGKWTVTLPPLLAGGPYELSFSAKNHITIKNVLIGEVWICSGQSNMEMYVQAAGNPHTEIAHAYHPDIRLFNVDNEVAFSPADNCVGTWEECRPSTVGRFSAAAYYFGRALKDSLGVPVGLINASWGGTPAESWMRPQSIASNPATKELYSRWEGVLLGKSPDIVRYYHELGIWHDDLYYVMNTAEPMDIFNRFGYSDIETPDSPVKLSFAPNIPGVCYNAMIAPFTQYALRGAIWYQGESNAGRAYEYRSLFPAMIDDWRTAWDRELPFLFVQLANFATNDPSISESSWAELREAQSMTLDLPATAMAVAIDIGDSKDIHPKNKQEIGRRLSLGALKTVYGFDLVHSGPIYESMRIVDGKIHIRFNYCENGLTTRDKTLPEGFIIAAKDGLFVAAQAEISGNEVIVWSQNVSEPSAVRYGWAGDPNCNLINGDGLPASPFRTDDWPGITAPE